MKKNSKIFVAGGTDLVGSAIVKNLSLPTTATANRVIQLMKKDDYLKAGGYTIMNYFE
ncbi:MAG: hypothetical protein L3J42_04580 [Hydrogenimonas sp.]|nr:hypothetical protein [Hydrogenimonas sp.]